MYPKQGLLPFLIVGDRIRKGRLELMGKGMGIWVLQGFGRRPIPRIVEEGAQWIVGSMEHRIEQFQFLA